MTQSSSETSFYAWNAVSNRQLVSWLGIDEEEFLNQLHNPLELSEDRRKFMRPIFWVEEIFGMPISLL